MAHFFEKKTIEPKYENTGLLQFPFICFSENIQKEKTSK